MSDKREENQAEEPRPEDVASEGVPEEEREKLLDRLKRLQAEYDNYRKRVSREQAEWTARAIERLVVDLLPVMDSFDRALAAAGEAKEASAVLEGMILTHKQLLGALKSHGVEPFPSLGEPFDPARHDAFMSRPAGPGEMPGTIVEEFLTGYRMGERTVRPAKGIVAVPAEDGTYAGAEEE